VPDNQTVEGYAALFGLADLGEDIVRAGAARASLARAAWKLPMLVSHDPRRVAGFWRVTEDARGIFVSGQIDAGLPGGPMALALIEKGADGLSIGFRANRFDRRPGGGRTLIEIDLLEVSIVTLPMQPLARLTRVRAHSRAAA
jgi:uncharacterized protein